MQLLIYTTDTNNPLYREIKDTYPLAMSSTNVALLISHAQENPALLISQVPQSVQNQLKCENALFYIGVRRYVTTDYVFENKFELERLLKTYQDRKVNQLYSDYLRNIGALSESDYAYMSQLVKDFSKYGVPVIRRKSIKKKKPSDFMLLVIDTKNIIVTPFKTKQC